MTVGGHNESTYLSDVEVYDTALQRRSFRGIWSLNVARAYHACSVVSSWRDVLSDAIVCAGGVRKAGTGVDIIDGFEVWDFAGFLKNQDAHKWRREQLRLLHVSCCIGLDLLQLKMLK